jgi:hypothetical protein
MTDNVVSILGALGVGSLIGTLVAAWLSNRRESAKRRIEFHTRQLEDFYGPLLSLRSYIKAHSELRVKLEQALDALHQDEVENTRQGREISSAAIIANIDEANETFRDVLMPLYRDMIKVFRDRIWLAEPSTRMHFQALIEFVEVWEKVLKGTLERAAARKIGHSEKNLHPFYNNLERVLDRLRREIDH